MALQLDTETLQELLGQSSSVNGLRGKVTYQESQGMGMRLAVGRPRRWIPEFAFNEAMLGSVILHCAITYVYRSRRVPEDLVVDLKSIDRLARDKTAHLKALADDCERINSYLAAVDRVGYVALLTTVAWRAWRNMPAFHDEDVASSLAMEVVTVKGILQRLKYTAFVMGYPVHAHRSDRKLPPTRGEAFTESSKKVCTDADILRMWSEGRTVKQMTDAYCCGRFRVVTLLKAHGLHYKRRGLKGGATPEQIAELWNSGHGTYKIAAELGTRPDSVIRHLKRMGLYVDRSKGVTAHK
jgi:hypothetical protein